MTDRQQYDESDPRHHTIKLRGMLADVANHAREDVGKLNEPKAQALFETITEVCLGLTKALQDYEVGNERAWQG